LGSADLTLGGSAGWPAPAKLNLFLHVVGRRADGYHLLQTVFQLLDYGDTLDFWVDDPPKLSLVGSPPDIDPQSNLVLRAASLLQEAGGVRLGARIRLTKRLPVGGGLGGGSSDAATTLVALNCLWGVGLSRPELAKLGLRLGADVPVFVIGRSGWAEGVGERLSPIELPARWFVVLTPRCTVPTGEVFAVPELTRNAPRITISDFLSGVGCNSCEPVVEARYPLVAELLVWLRQWGKARMTGTGSSAFLGFAEQTEALPVMSQACASWRGFVAQGVNESPLIGRLYQETGGPGFPGPSRS
jgi:4-diphosphocytidyl-2-C-methyl-D-erythritol kinase